MPGEAIFISYRREDTADVAGRVHEHFARRFGKSRVFMDVDNLSPGADFGEYIKSVLPRCRAALILIGPQWLEANGEYGARRLDDPSDWVRIEIEIALATPTLDVVPVLVNGARLPRTEDLPPPIRPLLRRHAAIIRRNPDFNDDVGRLISVLGKSVRTGVLDFSGLSGEPHRTTERQFPAMMVPMLGLTGLALIATMIASPWKERPFPPPTSAARQLLFGEAQQQIRRFVTQDYMGLGDASHVVSPELYAPMVMYYGRTVSRDAVLQDKRDYYARWPHRFFSTDANSVFVSAAPSGDYMVRFPFSFDVSSDDGRRSSGRGEVELKVRLVGDHITIMSESSRVQR